MKTLDKKKMIFWESFKDGDSEYFLSYTIVITPMWVFRLLSKLTKIFEKLKWACTKHWEATMETMYENKKE